jgi:hypothetical protein
MLRLASQLSVIFQEHVVSKTRPAQFCFPGFAVDRELCISNLRNMRLYDACPKALTATPPAYWQK